MDALSLTGKHWVLPRATNGSDVIAMLFSNRQLATEPSTLLSPEIFPDMPRVTERIFQAMKTGETIGIFGDYDCDGITAVAQLKRFFQRHGSAPWVRLPHRVRDGYGLKAPVINEVLEAGVSLLITADTGITATEEIATLNAHGVDTIITDHHQPREELPLAFAILHPALCRYPAPHPSGAGVVYKLIHALEQGSWSEMAEDTALAMLGTVADLVELRGENRTLTQYGLQALERISDGPIAALRDRCRNQDAPLTATDIAFRMAPRINAAGRMAEPDIALRALTETGDALSMLDSLNEERQALTRELYDRAKREFNTDALPPVLVSVSHDYPHGIIGLIAGKLTEEFGRPSLVAHTDGTMCTASLRSPASYHVALGLKQCHDLLEHYGGHRQAAGCSFTLNNLEALTEKLCADVLSHVTDNTLVPSLHLDAYLNTADINLDFCHRLRTLEPFGQGNREPHFLLENISLKHTRPCGKHGAHLTGRIAGKKCVGFGLGAFAGTNEAHNIAARLEVSEWNGRTEPQLVIADIAEATKKVRAVAPL